MTLSELFEHPWIKNYVPPSHVARESMHNTCPIHIQTLPFVSMMGGIYDGHLWWWNRSLAGCRVRDCLIHRVVSFQLYQISRVSRHPTHVIP